MVKYAGPSTTTVSKAAVVAMQAQERVITPVGSITPEAKYLAELADSDKVVIVSGHERFHGLAGKPSNNSRSDIQGEFITFVQAHRTPTGRTADRTGRFHGSVYFLESRFIQIKFQAGQVRDPASGEMVARNNCDSENILTLEFLKGVGIQHPGKKPVSQQTVADWFYKVFGVGSKHGHTTLHPHSTDACAECQSIAMDIKSLQMSLKRHGQQKDRGSVERQLEIRQLEVQIAELKLDSSEHRKEAAEAQEFHKRCILDAHAKYKSVCTLFEQYLHATSSIMSEDAIATHLDALLAAGGSFTFEQGSDYQEDKSLQNWGLSPQPGPVFFMSHETCYVHILMVPSCGEETGPSTKARRIIYARSELCGGSKDCNDTTSTICDYWLGPVTPTCPQPSKFRSGYDAEGAVLDAATAAAAMPNNASAAPISISVFPNVPLGMEVCAEPPTAEHFEFCSDAGATLVGCPIMFKWPGMGWLVAEIVRQNSDKGIKVGREHANFVCKYNLDGEEGIHKLSAAMYASHPDATDNSWVMLCAGTASTDGIIEIEDDSFTAPLGYAIQLQAPPSDQLVFKSPAGSTLVGCHILCNWRSHGWLVGIIKKQNTNGRLRKDGDVINVIVSYLTTGDEAEHSLRTENYATEADAPEHSWVLLHRAEEYVTVEAPYKDVKVDPGQPQPFVRHVRHIMDNCTGTNKSQFVFGTMGAALAAAILDVFEPYFGLPGHTKFECDKTAQLTATRLLYYCTMANLNYTLPNPTPNCTLT